MSGLDLIDHGWKRRPSGRYVHPDLPLTHGRRRVFTESEARTLTEGVMRDRCADCGEIHDPAHA